MDPIVILTKPKQELEEIINGSFHDQIAARLTIKAVMQYPVIARECQPYFE